MPDGARIVERFLAQWEDDPADPGRSFVTLTQAVSSAPEAARAWRDFLTERVWAYRRPGDPASTTTTAALISSQLLAAAWARYVIRMEPFASASRAHVAAWVVPAHGPARRGRDRHRSRRSGCRSWEDGGLCPGERLRVLVPVLDPGADVGFEGLHALVHAAADLLGGQVAEPPLVR
jgi:hypothetical protein